MLHSPICTAHINLLCIPRFSHAIIHCGMAFLGEKVVFAFKIVLKIVKFLKAILCHPLFIGELILSYDGLRWILVGLC